MNFPAQSLQQASRQLVGVTSHTQFTFWNKSTSKGTNDFNCRNYLHILGKIFGVSNRQSKYRKQKHENPNRKGSIIGQNNQVTYEWQWIDNEWQWKPKTHDVEEEYNWSPSKAYQGTYTF